MANFYGEINNISEQLIIFKYVQKYSFMGRINVEIQKICKNVQQLVLGYIHIKKRTF